MPELPDVEGHRRTIAEYVVGARVRDVRVPDPELLTGTSPGGLTRSLKGRVVAEPHRHGKWLWLRTDGGDGPTLVFHFRMTGELVFDEASEDAATDALVLVFDHGRLAYRTRRRLGGVSYLRPGEDVATVTGPLGPDATAVDHRGLATILEGRRGAVKATLMDQHRIAGLGNELVDEVLWRAGIHPRTPAGSIDPDRLRTLHRELRVVLNQSIRAGHVPSGPAWLNARRATDDPRCPRCGAALERAKVSGRTTVWCPRDQPAPS